MSHFAIAMDLGTSGIRAQALDLGTGEIISTAITTRHPLPGANVIDHLHFALEMSVEVAAAIMVDAVNRVIGRLHTPIDQIVRMAICGNPIQLSLFQGIEIRDLAFAGKRKLDALGVKSPNRDAAVVSADRFPGLKLPAHAEVIVPPAVRHEIGADALAMMLKTGMLDKDEVSLTTDYGTNAEMALYYDGRVITGSTAAGPALEGQQITCGMLAMPGSISDVSPEQGGYRLVVLDQEMLAALGPVVDFQTGRVIDEGNIRPVGITGTGTIALMDQAMQSSLVRLPRIETLDGELHLGEGLFFTEDDLKEAGKAIGSIRAGHITLCREAGISLAEVQTAYMSGASGTYVDPLKAQRLGMIPPRVEKIYQVGNTSLAMARDLAVDPRRLDEMNELAKNLRQTHCMFAASKVFERVYILELSYWTEGMPFPQYQAFLDRYGYSPIPSIEGAPEVIRTVKRDIDDLGRLGLTTIPDIGREVAVRFEGCVACGECLNVCPEKALRIVEDEDQVVLVLNHALCNGVACRRCERACPEKGFSLSRFFIEPEETQ